MNALLNRAISHRGLYDNENGIPENSLMAFAKAVEEKFAIELDVQLTLDGVLVVFHDYNLKRMTGCNKALKDCKIDELKKLNLLKTEYDIPTLDDVFKLVRGKVPILIEIKNNGLSKKIEKVLIEKVNEYNGDVAIESFNPFSMRYIMKHIPNIYRGLLVSNLKDIKMPIIQKMLIYNMCFNWFVKPNFIAYDIRCMPNKKVIKLKNNNMDIIGWTLKSQIDYEKIKNYCDGYIFEGKELRNILKYKKRI